MTRALLTVRGQSKGGILNRIQRLVFTSISYKAIAGAALFTTPVLKRSTGDRSLKQPTNTVMVLDGFCTKSCDMRGSAFVNGGPTETAAGFGTWRASSGCPIASQSYLVPILMLGFSFPKVRKMSGASEAVASRLPPILRGPESGAMS